MTRFARARGSKASNERVPEAATPWSVMKQQFLSQRRDNFSLEGKSSSCERVTATAGNDWTGNDKQGDTVWEDFGAVTSKNTNNNNALRKVSKSSKGLKKMKKAKDVSAIIDVSDDVAATAISSPQIRDHSGKKKQKNEKKVTVTQLEKTKTKFSGNGQKSNFEPSPSINSKKSNFEPSPSINSKKSNFKPVQSSNSSGDGRKDYFIPFQSSDSSGNDRKDYFVPFKGNNCSGNGRRNNFDDYPDTIMIGGNIVEIGAFQGFPVKKEDEIRLKKLRKDLQAKGIPRKEIEFVLKGERRRAEKALAREKKLACFNCRKFGHNVADCPELGDQTEVGKVCFKCGSTEHKYSECRVVPEKDAFRFAECFICKEQGHISRQCPDNPRGLYPKGGACKVCGSVTHLKKDCPDLVIGKEQNAVTVATFDQSSVLEALDEQVANNSSVGKMPLQKKRKIVKF
ncbi:uncharacterized protein LOC111052004 [Nilaparvata lugens]|uniref:uncharacterized protein LOC111052004 n=1 Tax=Nilaparvata lugens TaxID=108931 RepID=UPI00193D692F|nr:uncharacterized protein LOC111052004 [Nilaparvata lugens]